MGQSLTDVARVSAVITAVVISCVAGIFLLWQAASAILIILIGLLIAVIFDAGARGLAPLAPRHRKVRLVAVIALAFAAIGFVVWWGGTTIIEQAGQLVQSMRGLIERANAFLSAGGAGVLTEGSVDLSALMPNASTVFGGATRAATTTFGILVTLALVVFLGAFIAWEPPTYKKAVLSLLPRSSRTRVSEVLDQAAHVMRGWLVGQSISMAVIFAFTLVALLLIGMPYAVLLAVLAGLLVFIPTIGPFIAGGIIIVAGLSASMEMALYGLGVYVVIQLLESYLLAPIVQKSTVRLPPASSLSIQLIAGVFFGLLGVAFAIPLAAAAKVLIEELYVKDLLGGGWSPKGGPASRRASQR